MGMPRARVVVVVGASLVLVGTGPATARPAWSAPATSDPARGQVAAGTLVAAASVPSSSPRGTAPGKPIRGTSWRAVLLRDEEGRLFWVRQSVAPRMHFFRSGGVHGSSGCNGYNYRTTYSAERGLRIRGGLATTAGCGGIAQSTENAFLDVLPRVRSYQRDGRTLVLRGNNGVLLVVLRRMFG